MNDNKTIISAKKLTPAYPTHPGEQLKYNMHTTKNDDGFMKRIENIRKIAAML